MDKRQGEKKHARKRFKERYGISAGTKFINQIICQIRSNRATLIKRQSLRVALYWVEISGTRYKVVYDRHRKMVVTALPPKRQPLNPSPAYPLRDYCKRS